MGGWVVGCVGSWVCGWLGVWVCGWLGVWVCGWVGCEGESEGGALWIARLEHQQQPPLVHQFEQQLGGRLARRVRGQLWEREREGGVRVMRGQLWEKKSEERGGNEGGEMCGVESGVCENCESVCEGVS